MKLASFHAQGRDRIGAAIADDALVDLAEAAAAWRLQSGGDAIDPATFSDLITLIEAGEGPLAPVRRAVELARTRPDAVPRFAVSDVRWHPPVRRPSKLVCLALNNSANKDRILSGPQHPASFIKGANALTGHREPIVIKPLYGRCHPEPELAVVIGRRAKEIRAEDAYAHVFGYTIHNDITSPTMRGEDTFHYRAIHPAKDDPSRIEYVETWVSYPGRYKGSDTFSPLGPWLVTRDEIADPHALTVSCHHRGELVTEDSTANLFYKVPEVLAFLSQYMTLLPGDVVSMGTALKRSAPGARAVQNVELNKLGGPISVTISSIGTLENPVELE
ncbi:MAG TPA: fumarylacetoacetate hydrolase family protein [Steroidobacteraceae bacterium]|jgi:2-keto-4-pentenoate hydratase/2-oxohepta-3-ene-1,7-dioic acid hydratase in catechol pathway